MLSNYGQVEGQKKRPRKARVRAAGGKTRKLGESRSNPSVITYLGRDRKRKSDLIPICVTPRIKNFHHMPTMVLVTIYFSRLSFHGDYYRVIIIED